MDYLDPKKKKNKRARLMLGYALLGIAIGFATIIFVYLTNGYYLDNTTGTVIQNGLIYIDSKPESAEVYLNGEKQRGSTDARLVVPEGKYDISLYREGYRDWSRKLILEGGSLRRLTYARLVPEDIDNQLAVNLPSVPTMQSQSIDKRWLIMAFKDDPLIMRVLDLNKDTLNLEEVPLPLELLKTKLPGSWKVLDWADDNKTFLAEYRTTESVEYALIDRDKPENSINIKDVFKDQKFTSVSMRDRKKDLLFLHYASTGALFRANSTSALIEPVLNDVVDYTSFGNDAILYVSETGAKEGHVKAILNKDGEDYLLREIKKDTKYLLDMSKLGNALVIGVGSKAENRVIVFNDPIAAINDNDFSSIPVPTTVLRVDGPEELAISSDSSTIMARGGQRFASHEFDAARSYNYKVEEVPDKGQETRWMDGQHLTFSSGGKQIMMDFDGSNIYTLLESDPLLGSIFDSSIDDMYTFLPPEKAGSPARLMLGFMRTLADR